MNSNDNYLHSDEAFRKSLKRILFWSGACVALAWFTGAVILISLLWR